MITKIGSQNRELLKDSGYILISRSFRGVVILQDKETGKREAWHANNHHSGYTIQIGRWGYEFGKTV